MQAMFLIWLGLVILVVRNTARRGSVGLSAGFVLTMSFLYGGCFVYAVPGYTHFRPDGHWYLSRYDFTELQVVQGTGVSLLGLVGFVMGIGLARHGVRPIKLPSPARLTTYERKVMIVFGTISALTILLQQLDISFPLSGAIFELGRNFVVMLLCLGAFLARRDGRPMVLWSALAMIIPIYYIVAFGLASYGLMFGMTLTAFWLTMLKGRRKPLGWLKLTVLSALGVQVVLTIFVGWMSFREDVRLIAWTGAEGSIFDILVRGLQEAELFTLANFASLDIVNIRLNLPLFIGRMMDQHALMPELQLWGSTLIILPLVLLPRFLWAGKPERGGSDFMEEHSGIILSDSVTFGSGSVFELYANFGSTGVFLGFVALGWAIRRIDIAAYIGLVTGRYLDFARWYVMGLVALDPLLRPFFIVNGMVFAWILLGLLKLFLLRLEGKQKAKVRTMRPTNSDSR